MINRQSVATSTSSRTQHTHICQLRTNTTAFDQQTTKTAMEAGTTATTKHAFHMAYTSPKSLLGEKNHPPLRYRDECMPLVSSVDAVYYYDLRVAQRNNRNDFCRFFFCRKVVRPVFGTPSPCHKPDNKRACNRAPACVLLLVPILLARVQTTSMCPN